MDDISRMSEELALVCEKVAKHITLIEQDVSLSPEAKLSALTGVAKILSPVTAALERARTRLRTSTALKVTPEEAREMRRRIAAQIGGLGNHSIRKNGT